MKGKKMNLIPKQFVAMEFFPHIEDKKKRIKKLDNWLYRGLIPKELTKKIGNDTYFYKDKLEEFTSKKE